MAGGDHQPSVEEQAQRLAALEAELARLRDLVVRAYEDTQRATAELLRARRRPSYREAYGPEPLVTARIGAYGGGDLLFDRALRSVQAQSYPNWEAIVVCDGWDPETARRIEALGDPRIRCLQRPRNGPYPEETPARWQVAGTHPFNQAVALARGAWIAPIDQDDAWEADHLKILLEAARRSGAEVAYGVSRVVLDDGTETYFGSWPPTLGDFGFQAAIYHAGLAPFLLYDANSHLAGEPADWNLARRMLEAGVTFEFVPEAVSAYFVNQDEASFGGWKAREQEHGAFVPGGQGR
jgi:glycosyltransferase involved in cell wall biosynthesis